MKSQYGQEVMRGGGFSGRLVWGMQAKHLSTLVTADWLGRQVLASHRAS